MDGFHAMVVPAERGWLRTNHERASERSTARDECTAKRVHGEKESRESRDSTRAQPTALHICKASDKEWNSCRRLPCRCGRAASKVQRRVCDVSGVCATRAAAAEDKLHARSRDGQRRGWAGFDRRSHSHLVHVSIDHHSSRETSWDRHTYIPAAARIYFLLARSCFTYSAACSIYSTLLRVVSILLYMHARCTMLTPYSIQLYIHTSYFFEQGSMDTKSMIKR